LKDEPPQREHEKEAEGAGDSSMAQ
jgi:hypothetical protein